MKIGDSTAMGYTDQYNPTSLKNGDTIISQNNQYSLSMQSDNNLVLYKGTQSIWSTGTSGKGTQGTGYFNFQPDGNLVVYASTGIIWSSGTSGSNATSLLLQQNGNLVLYSNIGAVVWSTNDRIGTTQDNPMTIVVNGLYLDKGQFGNTQNKGILASNGSDYQKFWLDNNELLHCKQGGCLDTNGGNNWLWYPCDSNNSNQKGFHFTISNGQKVLQFNSGDCLDVGNDNMHWGCNGNGNQALNTTL